MWEPVPRRADIDVMVSQETPLRLVNEFLDCFVWWREEAATVRNAYDRWSTQLDRDEATAFAAYRAALDREEQAADVLRVAADRICAAERGARR